MKRVPKFLVPFATAAVISACAVNPQTGQPEVAPGVRAQFTSVFDSPNPCSNNMRNIGAVTGGILGAIAGHYLGSNGRQVALGAALGTGFGALIGHGLDSRRCTLYRVAQTNHLSLASVPLTAGNLGMSAGSSQAANQTVGLDVQLRDQEGEFEPGTAQLTPQAQQYFAQIAQQYAPATLSAQLPAGSTPAQEQAVQQRKVLIVGHTDESDAVAGADLARLSQDRALAVAQVFAAHGVPAQNIEYQGAGDTEPIASNATAQGRADNARVEIVDVPDLNTLKSYVAQRTANPADFQTAQTGSPASQTTGSETPSTPQTARASEPPQAVASSRNPTRESPKRAEVRTPVPSYGFDGQPLHAAYVVHLGPPVDHSLFSLVPAANAAEPVLIGSCLTDRPHSSTAILNLATHQALTIDDALPAMYGEPWEGTQGESAVALLHVYVPKDSAAPVPGVTVEFYRVRTYQGHQHTKELAVVRDAPVNVYRGGNGILYRVFLNGPAQCLDIDVPANAQSGHGLVIYLSKGRELGAHGIYVSKG
jgi:outer membrane protein OmpA-like peptidoglycan-associated protein